MSQAAEFFDAIDAAGDRETAARIGHCIRRLPRKYSTEDKARIRALTLHICSRGAGIEEALEMACKHVEGNYSQSITEGLRSRFWEAPCPSPANAQVLAELAKERGE